MARATNSGTISFGMVSIGVKFYTACSANNVRFNQLHAKCKGRLKQQMYCPVDDEVVANTDIVKGFEHSTGQYAVFSNEELKALEAERTGMIDLLEFVPLDTVDLLAVEKSYYLGPDKGADRAYTLLSGVMNRLNKVAVGRWSGRGKEQLVIIRPYHNGLVLHQMYYSNEVRNFQEIEDKIAKFDISDRENDLAEKLVEQLSSEAFDPSSYHDGYVARVNAAVQNKLAGKEVTSVPEAPKTNTASLFDALQASLDDAVPVKKTRKNSSKKPAATKKRKTA